MKYLSILAAFIFGVLSIYLWQMYSESLDTNHKAPLHLSGIQSVTTKNSHDQALEKSRQTAEVENKKSKNILENASPVKTHSTSIDRISSIEDLNNLISEFRELEYHQRAANNEQVLNEALTQFLTEDSPKVAIYDQVCHDNGCLLVLASYNDGNVINKPEQATTLSPAMEIMQKLLSQSSSLGSHFKKFNAHHLIENDQRYYFYTIN